MKNTADELKPKRYPDEKPSEDGLYWCHHHTLEYWKQLTWSADVWTYFSEYEQASVFCLWVDWFIPYRLDEPDELERVMKQSDKRTVEYTIELYSHWLKEQGYDVIKHIDQPSIKGRVLWHDEHIEIADLDGFDDTFMIASVTNPERYVFVADKQLKQCHKAVKERKPEIKACPNPECREKCNMDDEGYEEENEYYLRCEMCGYCSPIAYNPEEAIRLHNLIAGEE